MHPVLQYGPEQWLVAKKDSMQAGMAMHARPKTLKGAARGLPLDGQHARSPEAPGLQNRLPPSMQG